MDGAGAFDENGMLPRATWRLECSLLTDMRLEGARPVRVRVRDISGIGFMAECDTAQSTVAVGRGHLPVGSTVSLDLPGVGIVHARVRWSLGGRIGARFTQPLDFDAARAGLARAADMIDGHDPTPAPH